MEHRTCSVLGSLQVHALEAVFLLLVIFQLSMFLVKQGNSLNQRVPNYKTVPFHLFDHGRMVEFPSIPALEGVSLRVYDRDYKSHILHTEDPEGCLPKLFLQHRLYNSSIYPLEFYDMTKENVTFFNCSSLGSRYLRHEHLSNSSAQDMVVCPIYAISSEDSILEWDLAFCTKMFQVVSPISAMCLQRNVLQIKFPQPNSDIEKGKTRKILGIVFPGSILLALVFIACFYIYLYFKEKGDDQVRLEKFLEDYKVHKPTRFSYADLKRITNHFKYKLGEGAHGEVFKGKLSTEIQVAVKVINNSDSDGQEVINEVGTMGKIHHINVVRLLGFCADGFHRALVYDFFPNGSLQKFITSPDNKENFLGWLKLQQLALSIAQGIEYLHQGCDYRILHFDINPRNVLLDHNFTPKISDFGLAKLCSKNQSTISITAGKGTLGYIAPEIFSRNFGKVSYKADIYSYGILLLEMVGGRKNVDTNPETLQVLYPDWIHSLMEGGDISIHMEDEDDIKIARKLAIVGLWCIQWHPANRPSMKTIIQMLDGEVDKLKVPPTPFDFATSTNMSTIIPTRHLNLELEVVHEFE
ncbi:rust resistance kinase Lr10-like isoform X2 [Neltuma alba]|uniref:rust resistance kinase Lr10-like isoform X2 n=1 Tax=Neltuma alba TaxID=207710 RepID=UPI0010A536A0|nr:rust resistance kinase Lr10-like isoform X2 [Prosopis alba]